MKINLLVIGIILLFASCDPVKGIEFINKTDSSVDVIMALDTNSVYYKQERFENEMISDTNSIVITIEGNNTMSFYLGMGNWSEDELKLFARSMKKLEIITKEKTTSYDSAESIYELLHSSQINRSVQIEIE
ncbi:MAG: hypothetical protein AB8G11_15850 [Saprospiraceae bacterium]